VEDLLKGAFYSSTKMKIAGALARNDLKSTIKNTLNYEKIGGAPLLGVDGVVIIGHGRSKAPAIYSAIQRAAEAVNGNVVDTIEKGLEALPANAA
jgi:glycerol-3-phosphate acyltransferase PlsX